MYARGGGAVRAFVGAVLLASLLLCAVSLSAQDESALALWTKRAVGSLQSGDYSTAETLAKTGLDARGDDSDLLAVQAEAGYRLDGLVRPALARLDAALDADSFSLYDRGRAIVLKAELLARLRLWEESLAVLKGLPASPDADARVVEIRDLLALHDVDRALSALDGAERIWPSDGRFAQLLFSSDIPASPVSRRLAAAYSARLMDGSIDDPELAGLAVSRVADPRDRRHLLEAVRARHGWGAPVEALHYGLISGEAAVREYLSRNAGSLNRSVLERLEELSDAGGRRALAEGLASYSGAVTEDRDGDGVIDATAKYEDGHPVEWDLDEDQDGAAELAVGFDFGEPAQATWRPSAAELSYVWGTWPFLAKASLSPLGSRSVGMEEGPSSSALGRDWILGDASLAWRPLRLSPFPGVDGAFSLIDRGDTEAPTERALTSAAVSLVIHRRDGDLSVSLKSGIALRAVLTDQGRVVARIEYRDGRPAIEYLDQDGDGRFESRLSLDPSSDPADPLVLSYESDVDGDGVYEFKEELVPPYRRTWDLQADTLQGSVR